MIKFHRSGHVVAYREKKLREGQRPDLYMRYMMRPKSNTTTKGSVTKITTRPLLYCLPLTKAKGF